MLLREGWKISTLSQLFENIFWLVQLEIFKFSSPLVCENLKIFVAYSAERYALHDFSTLNLDLLLSVSCYKIKILEF